MFSRTLVFVFCLVLVSVTALPSDDLHRHKRDVMESMRYAWNEVVRTLSEAGDAVVNVFHPTTEHSLIDSITKNQVLRELHSGLEGPSEYWEFGNKTEVNPIAECLKGHCVCYDDNAKNGKNNKDGSSTPKDDLDEEIVKKITDAKPDSSESGENYISKIPK